MHDSLQKISVKITFYFNIFKQSILDFFWELSTYQYATFGKILKMLKIEKKMVVKIVFKLTEFEFVVKIEVASFYEALDAILRLFPAKFWKHWKLQKMYEISVIF